MYNTNFLSVLVLFVFMFLEVPLNWCTDWFIQRYRVRKQCEVDLKNVKLEQPKYNCLLLALSCNFASDLFFYSFVFEQ